MTGAADAGLFCAASYQGRRFLSIPAAQRRVPLSPAAECCAVAMAGRREIGRVSSPAVHALDVGSSLKPDPGHFQGEAGSR